MAAQKKCAAAVSKYNLENVSKAMSQSFEFNLADPQVQQVDQADASDFFEADSFGVMKVPHGHVGAVFAAMAAVPEVKNDEQDKALDFLAVIEGRSWNRGALD